MRNRIASSLLACLAVLTLTACTGKPADGDRKVADDGESERERLDRLRALPYLDFDPDDSPAEERDGVVLLDSARAWPGYSLYTLRFLCRSELVDLRGRVVNAWQSKPCGRWAQSELLPDGSLLVVGREGRSRLVLLKFDWNGELLWRRRIPVHHDAELTPKGDLLALAMQNRDVDFLGESGKVRDDNILRLDADGQILESHSLFDLFAAGPAPNPLEWVRVRAKGVTDLFHANSVEQMPHPELFGTSPLYGPDHVLVSIRHQDLVAIFDLERGRVLWSWGKGELQSQHDASLLPNGDVLIFDNGLGRSYSRIVEVDPRTDKIVWEYRSDPPERFYTSALGGAHRLPNGNTLIANSHHGEAFEVSREGDIVWRYLTPYKNKRGQRATIIRMKRHDESKIDALIAKLGRPKIEPAE